MVYVMCINKMSSTKHKNINILCFVDGVVSARSVCLSAFTYSSRLFPIKLSKLFFFSFWKILQSNHVPQFVNNFALFYFHLNADQFSMNDINIKK